MSDVRECVLFEGAIRVPGDGIAVDRDDLLSCDRLRVTLASNFCGGRPSTVPSAPDRGLRSTDRLRSNCPRAPRERSFREPRSQYRTGLWSKTRGREVVPNSFSLSPSV